MPASTSAAGGAGAGPAGPNADPVSRIPRTDAGTSVSAEATRVAIRARSGTTSPLPSGWTRFDRNTTNVSVAGSIQIDVPVKPVWPNEPSGNSSPRFDE